MRSHWRAVLQDHTTTPTTTTKPFLRNLPYSHRTPPGGVGSTASIPKTKVDLNNSCGPLDQLVGIDCCGCFRFAKAQNRSEI
jgi:hypothetical protein